MRDAAELTKLIKEGDHKDWTDLFLTRNEMYLGFQNELPWIGPYYNIGGSSIGDTFAEHTANPFFMGVDPMGNQMPYTDSMYLTKHESHEVAIFRAMAGEHDAGVHGFEIMELPMYQSNMEKGDFSLYSWWNPGNDGVPDYEHHLQRGPGDRLLAPNGGLPQGPLLHRRPRHVEPGLAPGPGDGLLAGSPSRHQRLGSGRRYIVGVHHARPVPGQLDA